MLHLLFTGWLHQKQRKTTRSKILRGSWVRDTHGSFFILVAKGGEHVDLVKYRITLDTQKSGVQKVLQGFETADKFARQFIIRLTSGGSLISLGENVAAIMYVYKYGVSASDSMIIRSAEVNGDEIIYNVQPGDYDHAGTTLYQVKVVASSDSGDVEEVLASARFEIDTFASIDWDDLVREDDRFSVLEEMVAKATFAYDHAIESVTITDQYTLLVKYRDGTTYESDSWKEAVNTAVASAEAAVAAAKNASNSASVASESEKNALTSADAAAESEKKSADYESSCAKYYELLKKMIEEETGVVIVDNLDQESPGSVLDARQGKVLDDKIKEASKQIASIAQTVENIRSDTNAIYCTTAAPAGDEHALYDLWFDVTNLTDVKPHYWNGSAWTLIQYGTSAIADESVTNDKIADAAVTNDKIKNGTITLEKLDEDSIFFDVDENYLEALWLSIGGDPSEDTGGGGTVMTNDYNKLDNLPTLNGIVIKGEMTEADPTIPAWAKSENPPTAEDIGALSADDVKSIPDDDLESLWDEVTKTE